MEGTYHRLKPSFSSWLTNTNLSNNSGNCGFMLSLSTTGFAAPQKGSVMPSSFQIQKANIIFLVYVLFSLSMSFLKKVALYNPLLPGEVRIHCLDQPTQNSPLGLPPEEITES